MKKFAMKAVLFASLTLPLVGCSSLIVPGSYQGKSLQAGIYQNSDTGDTDVCVRDVAEVQTNDATKTLYQPPQPRTFQCSPVAFDEHGNAALTMVNPRHRP